MNLRTITFWVIYDPEVKRVIVERRTKTEITERIHIPQGCVVVKMQGHYIRPVSTRTKT
jgi:hypothetical protein